MQGLPPPPWELTEGERLRKSNIFQGQLRLVEQLDGESKECGRWAARLRGLTGGNDDDAGRAAVGAVVGTAGEANAVVHTASPQNVAGKRASDWHHFWRSVENNAFLPAAKLLLENACTTTTGTPSCTPALDGRASPPRQAPRRWKKPTSSEDSLAEELRACKEQLEETSKRNMCRRLSLASALRNAAR